MVSSEKEFKETKAGAVLLLQSEVKTKRESAPFRWEGRQALERAPVFIGCGQSWETGCH
jgi:hypothetical protein